MTLLSSSRILALALAAGLCAQAVAQRPTASSNTSTPVDRNAAGDSPADPGPFATGLSPALTAPAIQKAIRMVADWQVSYGETRFNQQWTFAALYDGLLAASRSTGDPKYKDAVLAMAQRFQWKLLDTRFPHADDEAIGRAYLEPYQDNLAPDRIAATRDVLDRLIAHPDDPDKLLWWWCDALFMAPPVLARMSQITHDRRYLDYMDRQWWITSSTLFDPGERLYFRDASYFTKKEANGQKLFWARGNGWVLAGLASTLEVMPADYPGRERYVAQFRAIAARVIGLQQPDGLWRSGLLDPKAYQMPEVSGSAFFLYGLAWGVNAGLLDREAYLPHITSAWQGMLRHVYATGRLGSIQPIGAAPGEFTPSSSYVYGVGAFLLAGSELTRLNAAHQASGQQRRAHP